MSAADTAREYIMTVFSQVAVLISAVSASFAELLASPHLTLHVMCRLYLYRAVRTVRF